MVLGADINKIRQDFPILNQGGLVYLDNSATTQKPEAVINRMNKFYAYEYANIHRGSYPLSRQADRMYEDARETVREWIDAAFVEEVVFTKGSTEAINLVASAGFETLIHKGDNVIVTELEHSSNYFPWKHHCEKNGAELRVAQAQKDGSLKAGDVVSLIDGHTRMIAVTAMSNVTGFCPDLEKIISEAHRNGIPVLVDGAQGVVHQNLSVQKLDCDFLCFSGHKIYGPMGIGVLYGKKKYLEEMAPFLYGGDMVIKEERGEVGYKRTSGKYEAGTQNVAGAVGLEAALAYLKKWGFNNLLRHEEELAVYMRKRLETLKGIHVTGTLTDSPVITFDSDKLGAYDIGVLLANKGIAIRCGAHCAYPLMKRMGKESLCRISLATYNTAEEIDYVADCLEHICRGGG